MTNRNWQVYADLAAHADETAVTRLLDAVPGAALTAFGDGTHELAAIIDADSKQEATLFVRLLMLELGLEATGLTVTETGPEEGQEPFAPVVFDDRRAVRAQQWAQSLAMPVPALA